MLRARSSAYFLTLIGLIWLAGARLWLRSGAVGVGFTFPLHLSYFTAFALSVLVLNLMLYGWLIPLAIGILRLFTDRGRFDQRRRT